MRCWIVPAILALLIVPQFAAAEKRSLVHAELLADVSTIVPGKPFTVGVMFKIEPGWHIYWSNPGDAGLATEVVFQLPAGFTVSDVQYPTPMKFVQPGDIVGYGYENEVMLLATITPPADLKDSKVDVAAEASWLSCKERCIPGNSNLTIDLPVSKVSTASNEVTFKHWQQRLPLDVTAKQIDYMGSDSSNSQYTTSAIKAGEPVDAFPLWSGWKIENLRMTGPGQIYWEVSRHENGKPPNESVFLMLVKNSNRELQAYRMIFPTNGGNGLPTDD